MLIGLSTSGATPPGDLVDLLLECHERIRRFVAMAYAAATHDKASAEDIAEACSRVQRYFTEALPLHVADEELGILPRLRGRSREVDAALGAMEAQHRRHEPQLSSFLELVEAVARAPSDALQKERLAHAARELEREFGEHLALEETVIFPALRALLPRDVQTTIVDEIRQRRSRDTLPSREASRGADAPHPSQPTTRKPSTTQP